MMLPPLWRRAEEAEELLCDLLIALPEDALAAAVPGELAERLKRYLGDGQSGNRRGFRAGPRVSREPSRPARFSRIGRYPPIGNPPGSASRESYRAFRTFPADAWFVVVAGPRRALRADRSYRSSTRVSERG